MDSEELEALGVDILNDLLLMYLMTRNLFLEIQDELFLSVEMYILP